MSSQRIIDILVLYLLLWLPLSEYFYNLWDCIRMINGISNNFSTWVLTQLNFNEKLVRNNISGSNSHFFSLAYNQLTRGWLRPGYDILHWIQQIFILFTCLLNYPFLRKDSFLNVLCLRNVGTFYILCSCKQKFDLYTKFSSRAQNICYVRTSELCNQSLLVETVVNTFVPWRPGQMMVAFRCMHELIT